MAMKYLVIFPLIFVLNSCTYFMEHRPISYERIPLRDNAPVNYCRTHQGPHRVLSTNEKAPAVFEQTLTKILAQQPLSPIENSVLWALFQLNIRPDSSSPQAYLQVMIKSEAGVDYWSFAQVDPESSVLASYFFGLQTLLTHYKSKKQLIELARLLEENLPRQIPIGKEFAEFVHLEQKKLIKDTQFEKAFFKAQMPLSQDETLPRLPFSRLVRESQSTFRSPEKYVVLDHLFENQKNKKIRCNFDLNIYQNDIFLIEQEALELNNSFAYSLENKFTFMAVSSQNIKFSSYKNTFLLQGSTEVRPAAFCHYNQNLMFLSDHGRDPGQILFYYFQQQIDRSNSMGELDQFMRSARKLRLYNPDRILFESQRSGQELVNELNSQTLPVYHAASLGHVWIWNSAASSFLSDPRREGHHLCTSTP
jgi:hypothetical protein